MKHRPIVFRLGTLLVLGFCIATVGCGGTDPKEDAGPNDCDNEGDGGMMICPPNLNCEENWVRSEGRSGRLYQAVEITFNVPEAYDGPSNPYMVGSAFASDPTSSQVYAIQS